MTTALDSFFLLFFRPASLLALALTGTSGDLTLSSLSIAISDHLLRRFSFLLVLLLTIVQRRAAPLPSECLLFRLLSPPRRIAHRLRVSYFTRSSILSPGNLSKSTPLSSSL